MVNGNAMAGFVFRNINSILLIIGCIMWGIITYDLQNEEVTFKQVLHGHIVYIFSILKS